MIRNKKLRMDGRNEKNYQVFCNRITIRLIEKLYKTYIDIQIGRTPFRQHVHMRNFLNIVHAKFSGLKYRNILRVKCKIKNKQLVD